MDNLELTERLLKQYSLSNSRIAFLEKQLNMLSEEIYTYFYSRSKENVTEYSERINEMNDELSRLKYLKSTIEDSITMVNEIDERYKAIIQKYYFHRVRIEDIAEVLHISRSRCYELLKESIYTFSKIMFGNAC